jgi:hypothetical protein
MLPPVAPGADAVPDPIGLPAQVHREAADLVAGSVRAFVDALVPAASAPDG